MCQMQGIPGNLGQLKKEYGVFIKWEQNLLQSKKPLSCSLIFPFLLQVHGAFSGLFFLFFHPDFDPACGPALLYYTIISLF